MSAESNLKVVCVKWGTKYGPEYVINLKHMVSRHLHCPHDFVCFTDDRSSLEAISCKDMPDQLEGWWNKISLFRRDLFEDSPTILFFDLDMVIVNSIDFLLNGDESFHICASFSRPGYYNSSIMRFRAGAYHDVYDRFLREKNTDRVAKLHGDQDWIRLCIKNARIWSRPEVVSYKEHLISYSESVGRYDVVVLPNEAAVVAFHGKPNPHDLLVPQPKRYRPAPFVLEHWR